jgi:tetratricopeptide (TPR) repeat protein
MTNQLRVMISSTVRDLPNHREKVEKACKRLGMFLPDMMENLTATNATALEVSLKMANKADIYIGVIAFRYGYVPEGQTISITEAEYNRAIERGIPRLIFLMHENHQVIPLDVETGPGAEKLTTLKDRLQKEQVVGFFTSADDLGTQVIQALVEYRQPKALQNLHYISEIPTPPEAFIAHPYTLLQTHKLVGRQTELSKLTDWVTQSQERIYQARILSIVAIGGMGKSALTWKWFQEIAPQEMKPLAGRIWWSFYESDASFENFVSRTLAYVSQRSLSEVEQIPALDREIQLLTSLDREPFLIVFDGLERLLIAYARLDAAHLADDDLDRKTANFVTKAIGLPESASQSFTGQHRLRKTAYPRAGNFLRRLANVRASRILVSTRLYPADLQMITGESLGNCFAIFLEGLTDEDALDLWRAFGVSGSRDSLQPLFRQFEKHPLLLQALAGEVARFRRAPGDFEKWQAAYRSFNPFNLPLIQVKSHVLTFALSGLDEMDRQVLETIAAFRSPASYDTLTALVVGEGKPCQTEQELDLVLTELEDRGLVGWDKRANRYDLHPMVRGVVWNGLEEATRHGVYTRLQVHFEALPMIEDHLQVNNLEDLAPAIELYNTLIGLGRFQEASQFYFEKLDKALLYRLGANRQRIELLEMLFANGLDQLPKLNSFDQQASTLNALGVGYHYNGQPGRATELLQHCIRILTVNYDEKKHAVGLVNLAYALWFSGSLYEAEVAARRALQITRMHGILYSEGISLGFLSLLFATENLALEADLAFRRSLGFFREEHLNQLKSVFYSYQAEWAVWQGDFILARSQAGRTQQLASFKSFEGDNIRTDRLQGQSALGLGELIQAGEWLHLALTRSRKINRIQEELPTLIALSELYRRQGDEKAARELLDEVWEAAERGPYPMLHADACNVLAQIEQDAGNNAEAIKAATQAYQLAWCDGAPYAYHWGLIKAHQHLRALGAPEPKMPPFDATKFEPMPEVEIDPEDKFHVENSEI